MPIVDAQVHIWGADTPERPWPVGHAHRAHQPQPFSKDDLLAEMAAAGVDRAVIVPPSWEATATTSRWRRPRRIPKNLR
jgi:L-fuconolactonase